MIYRKVVKCDVFKFQIPCQNSNPRLINFDYIYRICYKNAKKGRTPKTELPFLKNRSEVFYRILGLSISITFFSYPAHSIEVVLNMRPHRFHNYRFFRLLILNHTIHKKIHLLDSFRDKSP